MTIRHSADQTPVAVGGAGGSYLEWKAILGGAAVAAAVSIVLLQFGSGIGLALGDPFLADGRASWNVVVAALWLTLVAVASAAIAGGEHRDQGVAIHGIVPRVFRRTSND